MQNTLFKKGLAVGIIVLFAGVSVSSSVSSKDVSISNNKIVDDNKEIRLLEDNQQEIYTIIDIQKIDYIDSLHPFSFFPKWIDIKNNEVFTIKGYKKPLFPLSESWFELKVRQVYAPFFIGEAYIFEPENGWVDGIAIGNIEWSQDNPWIP